MRPLALFFCGLTRKNLWILALAALLPAVCIFVLVPSVNYSLYWGRGSPPKPEVWDIEPLPLCQDLVSCSPDTTDYLVFSPDTELTRSIMRDVFLANGLTEAERVRGTNDTAAVHKLIALMGVGNSTYGQYVGGGLGEVVRQELAKAGIDIGSEPLCVPEEQYYAHLEASYGLSREELQAFEEWRAEHPEEPIKRFRRARRGERNWDPESPGPDFSDEAREYSKTLFYVHFNFSDSPDSLSMASSLGYTVYYNATMITEAMYDRADDFSSRFGGPFAQFYSTGYGYSMQKSLDTAILRVFSGVEYEYNLAQLPMYDKVFIEYTHQGYMFCFIALAGVTLMAALVAALYRGENHAMMRRLGASDGEYYLHLTSVVTIFCLISNILWVTAAYVLGAYPFRVYDYWSALVAAILFSLSTSGFTLLCCAFFFRLSYALLAGILACICFYLFPTFVELANSTGWCTILDDSVFPLAVTWLAAAVFPPFALVCFIDVMTQLIPTDYCCVAPYPMDEKFSVAFLFSEYHVTRMQFGSLEWFEITHAYHFLWLVLLHTLLTWVAGFYVLEVKPEPAWRGLPWLFPFQKAFYTAVREHRQKEREAHRHGLERAKLARNAGGARVGSSSFLGGQSLSFADVPTSEEIAASKGDSSLPRGTDASRTGESPGDGTDSRTEKSSISSDSKRGQVLQALGVCKTYRGKLCRPPNRVLRGLDVQLGPSQITALIASSGGGKTTFLNILAGDIAPDKPGKGRAAGGSSNAKTREAQAVVPAGLAPAGLTPTAASPHSRDHSLALFNGEYDLYSPYDSVLARPHIGYCVQDLSNVWGNFTVWENLYYTALMRLSSGGADIEDLVHRLGILKSQVAYGLSARARRTFYISIYLDHLLQRMGLLEFAKRKVKHLSGGQARRVALLNATVALPRLLILDESSSGVDPLLKRQIWKYVQDLSEHCSVLLTTHDAADIDELASSVLLMEQGRVVLNETPFDIRVSYGGGLVKLVSPRGDLSVDVVDEVGHVLGGQRLIHRSALRAVFQVDSSTLADPGRYYALSKTLQDILRPEETSFFFTIERGDLREALLALLDSLQQKKGLEPRVEGGESGSPLGNSAAGANSGPDAETAVQESPEGLWGPKNNREHRKSSGERTSGRPSGSSELAESGDLGTFVHSAHTRASGGDKAAGRAGRMGHASHVGQGEHSRSLTAPLLPTGSDNSTSHEEGRDGGTSSRAQAEESLHSPCSPDNGRRYSAPSGAELLGAMLESRSRERRRVFCLSLPFIRKEGGAGVTASQRDSARKNGSLKEIDLTSVKASPFGKRILAILYRNLLLDVRGRFPALLLSMLIILVGTLLVGSLAQVIVTLLRTINSARSHATSIKDCALDCYEYYLGDSSTPPIWSPAEALRRCLVEMPADLFSYHAEQSYDATACMRFARVGQLDLRYPYSIVMGDNAMHVPGDTTWKYMDMDFVGFVSEPQESAPDQGSDFSSAGASDTFGARGPPRAPRALNTTIAQDTPYIQYPRDQDIDFSAWLGFQTYDPPISSQQYEDMYARSGKRRPLVDDLSTLILPQKRHTALCEEGDNCNIVYMEDIAVRGSLADLRKGVYDSQDATYEYTWEDVGEGNPNMLQFRRFARQKLSARPRVVVEPHQYFSEDLASPLAEPPRAFNITLHTTLPDRAGQAKAYPYSTVKIPMPEESYYYPVPSFMLTDFGPVYHINSLIDLLHDTPYLVGKNTGYLTRIVSAIFRNELLRAWYEENWAGGEKGADGHSDSLGSRIPREQPPAPFELFNFTFRAEFHEMPYVNKPFGVLFPRLKQFAVATLICTFLVCIVMQLPFVIMAPKITRDFSNQTLKLLRLKNVGPWTWAVATYAYYTIYSFLMYFVIILGMLIVVPVVFGTNPSYVAKAIGSLFLLAMQGTGETLLVACLVRSEKTAAILMFVLLCISEIICAMVGVMSDYLTLLLSIVLPGFNYISLFTKELQYGEAGFYLAPYGMLILLGYFLITYLVLNPSLLSCRIAPKAGHARPRRGGPPASGADAQRVGLLGRMDSGSGEEGWSSVSASAAGGVGAIACEDSASSRPGYSSPLLSQGVSGRAVLPKAPAAQNPGCSGGKPRAPLVSGGLEEPETVVESLGAPVPPAARADQAGSDALEASGRAPIHAPVPASRRALPRLSSALSPDMDPHSSESSEIPQPDSSPLASARGRDGSRETRRTGAARLETASDGPLAAKGDSLTVLDVHYRYPKGQVALRGVSFSVRRGSVMGLVGSNGAGKSSLMACLTGQIQPQVGAAYVYRYKPVKTVGKDGTQVVTMKRLRRNIFNRFVKNGAYVTCVPQTDIYWPRLTVRDHLAVSQSLASPGMRLLPIHSVLQALELKAQAGQPARTLSGGQKRKLSLAMALVSSPEIILLDELTVGLDYRVKRDIWASVNRVRAAGKTLIVTTHDMAEVESIADECVILRDGMVVAGGSVTQLMDGARVKLVAELKVPCLAAEERVQFDASLRGFVQAVRGLSYLGHEYLAYKREYLFSFGSLADYHDIVKAARRYDLLGDRFLLEATPLERVLIEKISPGV